MNYITMSILNFTNNFVFGQTKYCRKDIVTLEVVAWAKLQNTAVLVIQKILGFYLLGKS